LDSIRSPRLPYSEAVFAPTHVGVANTLSDKRNVIVSSYVKLHRKRISAHPLVIRHPLSDAGKGIGRRNHAGRQAGLRSSSSSGPAAMASNGSSTVRRSPLIFLSPRIERVCCRIPCASAPFEVGSHRSWDFSCWAVSAGGGRDAEQLGAGEAAALLNLHPAAPPGPSPEAIRHGNPAFSDHSNGPSFPLSFLIQFGSGFRSV